MGAAELHRSSSPPAPRGVRIVVAALVAPLMLATAVALVVWWPGHRTTHDSGGDADRHSGTVVEVAEHTCRSDEVTQTPSGTMTKRCGSVTVRVDDGTDKGRRVVTELPDGQLGSPRVEPGAAVVLLRVEQPDGTKHYTIIDRQRGRPMLWLVVLAAAVIVGFARWRGLAAIAGLGVSFAVVLLFILPAISAGEPPLPVAIVGAATIMFAVLYLTHGISVQTSIAVLGTLVSLLLTGVLAELAAAGTHLTGFGGEDETTLAMYFKDLDVYGLLLAGIIIGSLGVLDDVTVTQAVTVTELAHANPSLSRRRLYRAASRVGRAHIASVVNTIVLAYAGASLPAMLLIANAGTDVSSILTNQFVAQEVVRSIVSTLGLVAAVPVTTALAAMVTGKRAAATPKTEHDVPAADEVARPVAPKHPPLVPTRGAQDDPWAEPETGWLDRTDRP